MVVEGPETKEVLVDTAAPKELTDNKVDSGMEEENSENLLLSDSSEDDDGEVIGKKVNKSKPRLILDEDSDDCDLESTKPKSVQTFTAEQALQAVMEDSSDQDIELNSSAKKRKIKRPAADDSSSDEELEADGKSTPSKSATENDDGSTAVADDTISKGNEDESSLGKRADEESKLADSDSSDSRSSSGSDGESSDHDNADNDEGFNEGAMDPKLLAKLKKGASKKPREKSARISKKEEMISLHSESQRMVREGRVNLPYHQPAPKSLNVFLARATKKQEEYRSLKGGVRDMRKAKAIEDVLQKTRIQVQPKTQEEIAQYSDSDDDWDPIVEKEEKSLKERVNEQLNGKDNCLHVADSQSKGLSDTHRNVEEQTNKVDECVEKVTGDDFDSLPDIGQDTENIDASKDEMKIGDMQSGLELPDLTTEKEAASELIGESKSVKVTDEELLFEWEKSDVCENESRTVKKASVSVEGDEALENKQNKPKNCNLVENKDNFSKDNLFENNETVNKDSILEDKENIKNDNVLGSSEKDSNINTPNQQKSSPGTKCDKKLKKEKLLALAGIDLNVVQPRLSGTTETFISLVEEEETPQHPGVVKLMDRLTKHTAKREKKHSKDLDISIVSKDKVGMDKEELKLNTFTYHVEEEDVNPLMKLETPGAKLMALKEQLQGKIKEKREVARQKRQELYNLDNEELAEEEVEMSDHSDTDVEDDEFEEQYGAEDYDDEEELIEDKPREKNPFAEDEAEDDGMDEEEEMEEALGNDDEDVGPDEDGGDADDEEEEINLKLDPSDDEEEEGKFVSKTPIPMKKSRSVNSASGNREDTRDAAEFKEPSLDKPFSMFGQRSRDNSFGDSQIQSGQKPTSLRLQIEDSQDLYGSLPQFAPTQEQTVTQSSPQNFNFFMEDSQSVMLDAEGYLKTKSTGKKKPSMISALEELSSSQDDLGDVMGLCSGKFVSQVENKDKSSKKSLFDDSSASNTQKDMEEFMGLCSGVFTDRKEAQTQGTKRKASSDEDEDSIEALSDNESRVSDKNDQSEDEEEGDTDHLEEDEEDIEQEKPKKFMGFLQKKGKIRKEFVEEEAELSGSEVGSDEDLDLPEEEDILELEEADKEMEGVDQEDLRDEVGRVHFKQLIDEDKRELLRFQEMYLADGDLHSDGGGRVRRFKWSNIDDYTQQDMFGDTSDGEGPEHEDPEETEWRKERFEREKFLKEQQEKEMNVSEDSQFLKFGQVFLKKKVSVDGGSSKDKAESQPAAKATSNKADTPGFPSSFYKLSKQKRGSFLARSKEALAKIAEMTKPIANPSAGAKSSGNFTFQVISPEKKPNEAPSPAAKQRKAHTPKVQKPVPSFKKPPLKRPKLDSTENSQNSVFNHLY